MLDALGKIDDKYIIGVQNYTAKTENSDDDEKENTENSVMGVEVINKTNIWRKIAPTVSIAAVFVLVVGIAAYMGKGKFFREEASRNNETDFSAILIQSIDEQNTAEAILNKNYENLTFAENFIVEFPEINSFATFTMTSKPSLSGQEVYDLFDSAVEKYFPDTFTEEEKKDLYQATGKNANGETISGSFEQYKGEFFRDDLSCTEEIILASMKRNALSELQSKYVRLSACKEYRPMLTYDLELIEYITKFGINWASLIGMLILIPMLMLGDGNCGMEQILFPTSTGRKTIVSSKLLVGVTVGLCMTAVCSVIQFFIMGSRWEFGLLNVPIQSISGFEECKIQGSVLTCMIVCGIIRVFSAVPFAMMICILSSLLKKEPAVISAAVILIAISAFLAEKFPSISMFFLFSAMLGIGSIKTYSAAQVLLLSLVLLLKTAVLTSAARLLAGRKQ